MKKYYPNADKWMWNYCLHLGPFTYAGHNYDLGVCTKCITDGVSAAIVFGDKTGDYLSGPLELFGESSPVYKETLKRWRAHPESLKTTKPKRELILCSDRLPSKSGDYDIKNNSGCNNGNGRVFFSIVDGWDIPDMVKDFCKIIGWYEVW